MKNPSIRNISGQPPDHINPRSSIRSTSTTVQLQRSKTFSSVKERKYQQQPLRHSNSRISEIIRQYNQANDIIKNSELKGGPLDSFIAPPPPIIDFRGKDEDWELQKSLEQKTKSMSRNIDEEIEKQKDISDMIVHVDYKKKDDKFKGYDFPKEPPKPTVPPRAPRGTLTKGTMTKGTLNKGTTSKKGPAPKAPPYLQFNFQPDMLK